MTQCGQRCEVFSRIVGYHRPIQNWNRGKKEEFNERVTFDEKKSMEHSEKLKTTCCCNG